MRALGNRSVASFLTRLLDVGWWGAAIALAFVACLAVVFPFLDSSSFRVTIPVSFSVDSRTHPVTAPSLGIGDAQIQGASVGGEPGFAFEIGDKKGRQDPQIHVRGSLRFPIRSRAFMVGNALLLVVMLALGLWVLGQLRAVFRTLRDGRPFVAANAARLRWIAFGVIALEIARSSIVFVENYFAMTHFSAEGLLFDARPDLNVFAILHGLIIFVIAEVFRAGTRLDEDQSLTV